MRNCQFRPPLSMTAQSGIALPLNFAVGECTLSPDDFLFSYNFNAKINLFELHLQLVSRLAYGAAVFCERHMSLMFLEMSLISLIMPLRS